MLWARHLAPQLSRRASPFGAAPSFQLRDEKKQEESRVVAPWTPLSRGFAGSPDAAKGRPLSPSIYEDTDNLFGVLFGAKFHYNFPTVAITSIMVRGTGCALTIGASADSLPNTRHTRHHHRRHHHQHHHRHLSSPVDRPPGSCLDPTSLNAQAPAGLPCCPSSPPLRPRLCSARSEHTRLW